MENSQYYLVRAMDFFWADNMMNLYFLFYGLSVICELMKSDRIYGSA